MYQKYHLQKIEKDYSGLLNWVWFDHLPSKRFTWGWHPKGPANQGGAQHRHGWLHDLQRVPWRFTGLPLATLKSIRLTLKCERTRRTSIFWRLVKFVSFFLLPLCKLSLPARHWQVDSKVHLFTPFRLIDFLECVKQNYFECTSITSRQVYHFYLTYVSYHII